jgi:hypothetical protein
VEPFTHEPFVLSLSKDKWRAISWFDKLTTNGCGSMGV